MDTYKKDIENFEYNKRFNVPNEHKWCGLGSEENLKKFLDEKEELIQKRYERSKVQSNPETTGQHGTML